MLFSPFFYKESCVMFGAKWKTNGDFRRIFFIYKSTYIYVRISLHVHIFHHYNRFAECLVCICVCLYLQSTWQKYPIKNHPELNASWELSLSQISNSHCWHRIPGFLITHHQIPLTYYMNVNYKLFLPLHVLHHILLILFHLIYLNLATLSISHILHLK